MRNDERKHQGGTVKIHRGGDFHWVGDGFPVKSVFGYNDLGQELSPFLLLDYAAPYEFPAALRRRGVGGHPHRGFETVTIAYQGELEHRDSHGGGGLIGAGDVQWMTAAGGIVHEEFHSEKFTREGGTFEMVQLWVNLPGAFKGAPPAYQTIAAAAIPHVKFASGGHARIIAGDFAGTRGPARTFTPINLWDVQLAAGARETLPLLTGHTKAVLILRGALSVGGSRAVAGDLAIAPREIGDLTLEVAEETRLLVMSGQPIEEPIVGWGPFVMNTEGEIRQAFADYKMGKMGSLA